MVSFPSPSAVAKDATSRQPQVDHGARYDTVVLFDGGCRLCAREIAHYRRLNGAERLTWVDIRRVSDLENRYGIRPNDAMARFHVRDRHGRWLTGAWAFAELWSHLPWYRLAGAALRRLRLLPLIDRAYAPFARWRLARRCREGSCNLGPHRTE